MCESELALLTLNIQKKEKTFTCHSILVSVGPAQVADRGFLNQEWCLNMQHKTKVIQKCKHKLKKKKKKKRSALYFLTTVFESVRIKSYNTFLYLLFLQRESPCQQI